MPPYTRTPTPTLFISTGRRPLKLPLRRNKSNPSRAASRGRELRCTAHESPFMKSQPKSTFKKLLRELIGRLPAKKKDWRDHPIGSAAFNKRCRDWDWHETH